MARPRNNTPRYLEHKQSGRGRAVYWDAAGNYHDDLLPGSFNSKESLGAFGRLLLEQEAGPKGATIGAKGCEGLTVVEVLDQFLTHAEAHYRHTDEERKGLPTSTIYEVRIVAKAVAELYGETPAAQFGPLALKACCRAWVNEKRSRTECNRRVGIVKRVFKWAAAEELVPAATYHGLAVVSGLQRGRTTAPETNAVGPVDDATVDATLPFLNRYVAGLIELQRHTGCRPGEACSIRRCDIDTGGKVWLYRPAHHKNAHRGKSRVIAIGPRAQEALKPFLTPELSAYLFPPAAAIAEVRGERTKKRKTPLYQSHQERNTKKRKRAPRSVPKDRYTHTSYARAVARACDEAFPLPAPLAQRVGETQATWKARLTEEQHAEVKAWRKSHRWHPNMLRHSFATKVRKQHGLEAAQVLLGHAKADTTQIYAERNEALAVAVAAKMG